MKSMHADFSRPVHCILGLPFDAITLADAVEKVRRAAFERRPCFISTPNLNFLMAAQTNVDFRRSVLRSDLSLPDGMPIVWMAKLMNIPITERVAGADLFDALRKCKGRKLKVYFFGGPPGVAERAMQAMNAENGGVECVGFETPGFGPVSEMSSPETLAKINSSGAEFLVVSLGAVKGQAWIEHNLEALQVPVVSHLGAVVNFVAGNVKRAPKWMQVSGLEWVWRILMEPTLLGRYWFDIKSLARISQNFLMTLIKTKLRRRKNRADKLNWQNIHVPNESVKRLKIFGSGVNGSLNELRKEIASFCGKFNHIELEIGAVDFVDSEFFGLLAIMYGCQINGGCGLTLIDAEKRVLDLAVTK